MAQGPVSGVFVASVIGFVMRLLLVEDEDRLARDLSETLDASGFLTDVARDGETAWFLGDTEDYDAVILDLGLPQMDGISVLKKWRATKRLMPVLILTARGNWTERVDGIDAGADDYLAKPFQVEELLARLHAILRRTAGQAISVIKIGPIELDPRQMRVSSDGAPLSLLPLEYRVLHYLMHNSNRIVTQHELLEHIYGSDDSRDNNALEALIGRLRRKLGTPLIETRRGYGYMISSPAT